MNEIDNIIEAGNEILREVSRAVDTGNYSNLGGSISSSVQEAIKKSNITMGNGRPQTQSGHYRASAYRTVRYDSKKTPFFAKKVSKSLGNAKKAFGWIGSFLWGVPTLVLGLVGFGASAPVCVLLAAIFGLLTVGSVALIRNGNKDGKLVGEYYKYGRILCDAEFFAISDLAQVARETPDRVLENIKEMIDKDILPQALIDRTETTVMLTPRAMEQYNTAERARLQREREAQSRASANVAAPEQETIANSKVAGTIKEGNDYLETIRRVNEQIPGDEMSDKLYKLESIMRKIFNQVEKEPECADDLKKFMNYYLPTTTKLLNAYVDLDKQPDVGDNIVKTKREIEDALDVINAAFENLLDSLFQDMAWDISSDISVMKTMMAQDGLTESGLDKARAAYRDGFSDGYTDDLTFGEGAALTMPAEENAEDVKPQLKF